MADFQHEKHHDAARMPSSRLRKLRVAVFMAASVLAASNTSAGPRYYLIKNELFCDDDKLLCIRGSLRYEVNPRLFRLWGRVQTSPGRGLLRIRLNGTTRLEHVRTTMMEIQLRGTYSEVVDYKMIPDHPDVENWEVFEIEFEPGERSPPAESRRQE